MSHYHLLCKHCLPVLGLLLIIFGLTACEIQGGADRPTPDTVALQTPEPTATPVPATEPAATVGETPTTADTTPTPGEAVGGSVFQIGLLGQPADLLPYHTDALDERLTAPVSELLFPSPLLAQNYTYTTTGVLERIPSFANGDAELRPVQVYLDNTGVITSTETEVLTDAQQLVITYRWNPDLRWSDGEPLTAADSLFAYELAQQLPLGEEAEKRLRLTERYEQVDDYTTRAYLNPDLADVDEGIGSETADLDLMNTEYLLSFWTPLPRHILQFDPVNTYTGEEFAAQPVSYGPYMVARNTAGNIRLERNPYYNNSAPLPSADVVAFAFFPNNSTLQESVASGSIDVAVTDRITRADIETFDEASAADQLDVAYVPNPIWEHLAFNLTFDLLDNSQTRQAIAYGTNREALVEALYGEQGAVLHSWIVPDHWAAAPPDQLTTYSYDPDQARALLDEVNLVDLDGNGVREQGFDHDSDDVIESSVPITLTLLTTEDTPLRSEISQRLQEDMAEIGLAVAVQEIPAQDLFNYDGPLFRRDFELTQFAWIASPDPRGFELWSCTAIPREFNNWSGSNLPGWCEREANQSIITATTALQRDVRREAYQRHQQVFTQQLPVIPLFQHLTAVLSNPSITGLQPDPTAPITWNIARWRRE